MLRKNDLMKYYFGPVFCNPFRKIKDAYIEDSQEEEDYI